MGLLNRLHVYFARQLRQRAAYDSTLGWLKAIYNRAMLASPRLPWPGRGRVTRVGLRQYPGDLHVRLGTSDLWVLDEVLLQGEYAPLLAHDAGDVRTIVDLGANIGLSVRLWRSHYPEARIIALEPDAGNVRLARRNAGGSEHDGVRVLEACAGGTPRVVQLDRSGLQWAFKMADAGANTGSEPGAAVMDVVTVPQLIERYQLGPTIDLLKCDVEGAEAEIFADCAAWIGRVRNLVVELHEPYTRERFLADLRAGGAEPLVYATDDKGGLATLFIDLRPAPGAATRP